MASKYATAPDPDQTGWPKGVPYIIGNEACERFSFYGMKAILFPYLTLLYVASGLAEEAATKHAGHDYHLFVAGVYALPMIGAIISDKWIGKYLTIMSLSLVYCAGHAVLAFAEGSLPIMHAGLLLICIGAGGIKSCVSANVGDQFGKSNWPLTKKVFQFFYLSVNFGSFFSNILTPQILRAYGPGWAFGIPGILMFIATIVFWWGRYSFVHIPPKPGGRLGLLDATSGVLLFCGTIGVALFGDVFSLDWMGYLLVAAIGTTTGLGLFFWRQSMQPDDGFLATVILSVTRGVKNARDKLGEDSIEAMKAVFRVMFVFTWVSLFWALFDQHGSTWVQQAGMMDRHLTLPLFGTFELLPAQTQSMNPALVLILIPLLLYGVFPALEKRGVSITPLRRMTVGMFLAALSFVAVALVQRAVDKNPPGTIHVAWQLVPYVIITLAEVLVSATGLEFAYSQAPRRVKSSIMGFWQLTVTFGNKLVAVVLLVGEMKLEKFFWLFSGLMAGAAVLFMIIAIFYKYRDYPQ
jgi:proton-dependent oligopeptide transporter, POT family